jgi:hypothetical protein
VQLLHFGATLAVRPRWNILLIDNCVALALAHVGLPQTHPQSLTQVLHIPIKHGCECVE